MSKKQVQIMCTAFRDGFQSVYGARVATQDFLPAVEAACHAGLTWFESGGGARFQSLYFYCNEDAFTMMDEFRRTVGPHVNLQTLARGVNVVGLDSQPADMIRLHAQLFRKHGVTTIRNFDALNDVNNLIYSGRAIVEAGLKHQVCVTMMALPPGTVGAHDAEFYEKTLRAILDAEVPFDSVCFKDASGTATPSMVFETVQRARRMLPTGTHIHFHSHNTAGVCLMAYKAALDAGADGLDLSLAPVSGGTCQPDILEMWHALKGTHYDLGIDPDKIREAEAVFKDCMKDYFLPPEALSVDPEIIWSPMPGGALTANTQMLRDNKIMDKYPQLILAMSEVVKRGGFGTSVTPVSQFYFQQAFNNVMFGPWKKIADGYGKMVLGYFGRTPVPADPEIVKIASEQLKLEPTQKTPLEIDDQDPKKGGLAAKNALRAHSLPETDENIFIAATCKEKGIAFLKGEAKIGIRKKSASDNVKGPAPVNTQLDVTVNGKTFNVKLDGSRALINGKTYDFSVQPGSPASAHPMQSAPAEAQAVKAPIPGSVFRVLVQTGYSVRKGQKIMILEAMKMEVEINSPADGTIASINVKEGQQVQSGQTLIQLS